MLFTQARINMARTQLQKGRRRATGLLLIACMLFITTAYWVHQYSWLGYMKAFAEAAMVGALADWFAVTALFRRPLGLPIPHTAILPRNQQRIADELARFIEHNFLQGHPIALRVYRAAPSDKLLKWLGSEDVRARWLPWLVQQVPALLKVAKPEQVARFGSMMLSEQYSGDKIGQTLASALTLLKSQGLHETLLTMMMKQIRRWLQDSETRTLLEENLYQWAIKIEESSPSSWQKLKASFKGTLMERVDDWVAGKALDWADDYLASALSDDHHRIRQSYDEQIERIIHALEHSRLWHKRLEAGKIQLAQSPAVQQNLIRGWQSLQAWTASDIAKPDSLWQTQVEKLLNHMLNQAAEYPQFMKRLDVRLAMMTRDFVLRYKHKAAEFVAEKVKSWDSAQMVDKLELSIGKDLQFIRINGTLVGGFVGLAIYCLDKWLF